RLGDSKIDHLWHRDTFIYRHQNVRGFDVPMDDALLMGVSDGETKLNEELQSFFDREVVLVAVLRDWDPSNQFHDEKWPTAAGRTTIKDGRDVGMVHQR